jgi:repressor LexA
LPRAANSFRDRQRRIVHIPLYGSIPAGFADERHQEAQGCVSIDAATLGTRSAKRLFALRVKGDSMTGKHILHGDIAILEQCHEARTGDVVAALIDGESTLKIYEHNNGKPFLRAANPHYRDLHPSRELTIQGVLVAVLRSVHR